MADLLKEEDMDQLEQWIGTGPKTFTLLYKISRDGCNVTTFHQKCDNQGPTVTVLYNQQQTVYGGYTSQSWKSSHQYIVDTQAFLFRLHYNGKPNPVKMPRNGTGNDVYGGGSHGPLFGNGHNLYTFNGNINASGGYFALNGHVNIGYSYSFQGLQVNDINNGNMNVTDLEVYKVTDGIRQRKPNKPSAPWREIEPLNEKFVENLEEEIVAFKIDKSVGINQARILFTGPVGAGKSSWCNTINSVFKGRVTQKAYSGSAEESLTTQYTQYSIRTRTGSKLNFRLCDTRGLEENQGLDSVEFTYLLDGHIPNYYEFNPAKPIAIGKHGFIANPSREQRIHMVVFVLDASTLDVLQDKLLEKMKNFQKISRQKGVPQVMILTQIDKVCKDATHDMTEAFRSADVERVVEKAAQTFGLPLNCVLPVKNYQSEVQLRTDISGVALLSLKQILSFTEDYMENLMDQLEQDPENDND